MPDLGVEISFHRLELYLSLMEIGQVSEDRIKMPGMGNI